MFDYDCRIAIDSFTIALPGKVTVLIRYHMLSSQIRRLGGMVILSRSNTVDL